MLACDHFHFPEKLHVLRLRILNFHSFSSRIVQNGQETVEVKTDGKVTYKSIDGVEQDLPKLKSK